MYISLYRPYGAIPWNTYIVYMADSVVQGHTTDINNLRYSVFFSGFVNTSPSSSASTTTTMNICLYTLQKMIQKDMYNYSNTEMQ